MSGAAIDPVPFKAYDIRGIVPDQIDAAAARLIGRALATLALDRGVGRLALARDGRTTSPELAQALAGGVTAEGVDVVDLGMLPTPIAYWAAQQLAGGSSVVVTGSHNPKEYNGFKMTLEGIPLAGEDIQQLRTLIEKGRFANKEAAGALASAPGQDAEYRKALLAGRSLPRKVKAVVDCGNGVAGPFYPDMLSELGCEVVPLYTQVDGSFPNHHPDPADLDNFKDAVETMEREGAELALAFDGDGDRMGAWVAGKGIFYPDRILMLLAQELLARKPGSMVVYDVKCSVNLDGYIAERGGEPRQCRTGHSFMKRELASTGAPLGGELSGHFFFNEGGWKFDDALLAAVLLLQMVAASESAAALYESVPDSHATPEYKVALEKDASPHAFVERLLQTARLPDDPKLVTVDGLRAEWPDGFGLVRASNTTPSLILRFEGRTPEACARIKDAFRSLLAAADDSLPLSF